MAKAKRFDKVDILYDGECPFCSAYLKMARLKTISGEVSLFDARQHPDLVNLHSAAGRKIDQGMVVDIDGVIYFGGEAVWAINAIVSPNPLMRVISSKPFLLLVYPAMRAVRNTTVRLLGHSMIQSNI